jgi:hypothetical protein
VRRARHEVEVTAPVVAPDAAVEVFSVWADHFDVWTGWFHESFRFNRRRPAKLSLGSDGSQFIYFAIAKHGPVKVGLSENPLVRVRALPGYSVVAAISHQDRAAERRLHDEIADFQFITRRDADAYLGIKYEWFARSEVASLAYRMANAATGVISTRVRIATRKGAA